MAAWGCDGSAARALVRVVRRGGAHEAWSIRVLPLPAANGVATELILIAVSSDVDEAALAALAEEIGAASCDLKATSHQPSAIERFTESVEQLGEAIAILGSPRAPDDPIDILYVNTGFTYLFGYSASDIVGRSADVLWGPLTDRDRTAWMRARLADRAPGHVVVVLYTRGGSPMWTEVASTPVQHESDTIHHVVTFRDVTSRKHVDDALAAEKRKLQTTLAAIADAVVTVLADGRVEFVNAAAQRLLGIELADAYGKQVADVVSLHDDDDELIDLAVGLDEDSVRRGNGYLRTGDGTMNIAYVASRVDAEEGGTVVVLRDVTDERRLAQRLTFEAAHDPLTGLQNRRAFGERLNAAVTGARDRGEHHVVCFLDLDRFKVVNDCFGHAAGDRLLREIGGVMGRVVRGGDVLARIGGDEFALLLSNCRVHDARRVAEKLREAVEAYRIEHHGRVLGVGVSVGLAAIEADTISGAQALSAADAACYQAKAAGRNAIAG